MPIDIYYGLTLYGISIAAVWAHEVTHAIAAKLFGADVSVQLLRLETRYTFESRPSTYKVRAIGLAPQATSVVLTAVYLYLYGWPSLTIQTLPWLLGWVWYTIMGGYADLSVLHASGRLTWWTKKPAYVRMVYYSFGFVCGGWALVILFNFNDALSYVSGLYGQAFIAGGIALLYLAGHEKQKINTDLRSIPFHE